MFLDFNLVRTLMRDNLKKSLNKKKKKKNQKQNILCSIIYESEKSEELNVKHYTWLAIRQIKVYQATRWNIKQH